MIGDADQLRHRSAPGRSGALGIVAGAAARDRGSIEARPNAQANSADKIHGALRKILGTRPAGSACRAIDEPGEPTVTIAPSARIS